MKRAIFFSLLALCACQGAGAAGGPDTLPAMTQVFSGFDAYDAIAVHDELVWVELAGAGVATCPTSGCTATTTVTSSDSFVSAALGSPITYAAQVGGPDGVTGELHVVDATGDHAVATGLSYPSWVASSGARTFVADDSFSIDDTPATVACVGCTTDGSAATFMSGLGGATYGLLADASNVYVLADDPTLSFVELLSCPVSGPCDAPRALLGDLDQTVTTQQIASDGASVYVIRAKTMDIARIDASGSVNRIATIEGASAIAWDAATSTLYYATSDGEVGHMNRDGSGRTPIARATGTVRALAVDATNVWAVAGDSGEVVLTSPK